MSTNLSLDNEVIADVAELVLNAVEPNQLEPGGYYVVVAGGQPHRIDLTGPEFQDLPKRKAGTTTVRDVASFASYWGKHSVAASEVYADRDRLTVTAVLDAHGGTTPNWGGHRLVLALKHSSAWTAWKGADGREMTQAAFAEFLEDNRADISRPTAAAMLEVAQSIQAVSKVDFASGFRLVDGQRRLTYTETIDAKAGQRGELAIPAEIVLRLPVFNGATVGDELTARFRHRIADGQLRLSYRLDRPDDVVDAAFEGVVSEVAEQCAATVLRGTPA